MPMPTPPVQFTDQIDYEQFKFDYMEKFRRSAEHFRAYGAPSGKMLPGYMEAFARTYLETLDYAHELERAVLDSFIDSAPVGDMELIE